MKCTPRLVPPIAALAVATLLLFGGEAGIASADPGGATSGSADASSKTKVIQKDIQIIAGSADAENSSQTASNEVNAEQLNIASSGDATATDGGTARSGDASASSFLLVHQMNIQVIAGKGCSANQDASNVADSSQTSVAISGDASASGAGSTARSGNARASNTGIIHQRNHQVYVCTPRSSDGHGDQSASNAATLDQTAVAVSGDAAAESGGGARSGDAEASNRTKIRQSNSQVTID